MKSQPQESLIKTSCKNCAFAIYKENTQTDCSFGRIEKFRNSITEAYDDDREFYVIDRLCTYFRDKKWGYDENSKNRVEEESAVSFDIIFNCNEITEDFFTIIQNFLTNNSYYKKKYKVFLVHEHEKPVRDKIIKLAQHFNSNTIVSCCFSFDEFVHEQTMRNQNVFHAVVSPENKNFSDHYLKTVNKMLNEDLVKFVVVKIDELLFMNNFLYKSIQYIQPCADYKQNIKNILSIIKRDMYEEIKNDS